jgi:hypothetical protein
MGILSQLAQVVKRVSCRRTGTILGCTNIDSIGTMLDGLDATLEILRRSKEFNGG